ncbi:MAG TPA: cytochrome c biogenesis protein CcsA [Salinisphaeraceae bacterium]|nr:cytochrome c biogenesis protein CcsA [Salinisphaeraceae bacterium]
MTAQFFEVLIAFAAYAAAGHAVWQHLRHGRPHWRVTLWAALALAVHALALLHASLTSSNTLILGVGSALSLFAWQSAVLLWLFSLRESIGALGLVIYPLAGISAIIALVLPAGSAATETLLWQVQLHILLSMLAYGLLTLGAVQAIILALQHRQLRRRPPGALMAALPSLESMERLLFRLLVAGFFLLTLAIVTGVLFIADLFAQHLAHKTILSCAAWLVFAVLLWGRRHYGWRGRTALRGVLSGYSVLVLAYFGSKLVLELFLGEHWH